MRDLTLSEFQFRLPGHITPKGLGFPRQNEIKICGDRLQGRSFLFKEPRRLKRVYRVQQDRCTQRCGSERIKAARRVCLRSQDASTQLGESLRARIVEMVGLLPTGHSLPCSEETGRIPRVGFLGRKRTSALQIWRIRTAIAMASYLLAKRGKK